MVNIVYCGNEKVIDGIYISSLSIVKHLKEDVTFYVLTMDLTEIDPKFTAISEEQISFLNEDIKKYNPNAKFVKYDVKNIFVTLLHDNLAKNNSYTPYALIRLLLDEIDILPSKVLYLDTDTVANKNIKELYNMSLENLEGAAAVDYIGKFWMRWMKKNYFNSGVMLYNLDVIKETRLFSKCRHYVLTRHRIMLDQDALNTHMKKFVLLDSKYNRQNGYSKDCVIQHFSKRLRYFPYIRSVNIKPWDVSLVHSNLKIFEFDDILNIYLMNKDKLHKKS